MNQSVLKKVTQPSEVETSFIQSLIDNNPEWHRTRISKELCRLWDWKDSCGNLKDMACRNLLLKLHRANQIQLPPLRRKAAKRKKQYQWVAHQKDQIKEKLNELLPLKIMHVEPRSEYEPLLNCLLSNYHYLSYKGTVGKNMRYLVSDRKQRPLSCVIFEAAAWKIKKRDDFIGWDNDTRLLNLELVTNNSRFLILPWVTVPNLASYILSKVSYQLRNDWKIRYRQSLALMETFIESNRFKGSCYRAANWLCVGQTKGRTRNDKHHTIHTSIKDVYLFPLIRRYKQVLNNR